MISEQGRPYVEDRLDLRQILRRLIKRKMLILVIAIAVFVPAVLLTFMSTPLYQSTALIQISSGGSRVLPYRDLTDPGDGLPSYESLVRTQEQILKSATLIDRVAKRMDASLQRGNIGSDPSSLADKFQVKRIPESQLFEIRCLAPSPELAARLVNLFVEEYIKEDIESRQIAREKARQALHRELDGLEKRIQLSERELVEYAQVHKISNSDPGQPDPIQGKIVLLDQMVITAEAERLAAKSRLETIEKVSVQEFPEKLMTSVIQELTTKLLGLEHDLTAMRAEFGENWPALIQKRNEIALVRDQLKREKLAVLSQSRQQALLDLNAVESRYRMMQASRAEQQQLQDQVQQASIQYNILRREAETNRKLYEALLERFKQSGVVAGFESGNIQVIEPGRPNSRVASPKILWNLTLASFLALALGVCVAFLADFWDSSVVTVEEAEQLISLPSLGCVPLMRTYDPRHLPANGHTTRVARPNSSWLLAGRSLSPFRNGQPMEIVEEQIRNICASILLSRSENPPQVIAFTSAVPMEGKTTLVSRVGKAFAENGARTLLVEADLRKPDLAKIFGAGGEAGLSLYLAGHVSPLPRINSTNHPNLYVVAAGPKAPNPGALVNSERMGYFLSKAASSFQFVLLDCPPLLAFADSRILCSRAEGTVLVVRSGSAPGKIVRRARAILADSGANILGLVLNGADPDDVGAGYYGYYRKPSG
ncbi:MAG: polysaccharide biosynthesis tyrosine autokinase [Terriglobia bacterium]